MARAESAILDVDFTDIKSGADLQFQEFDDTPTVTIKSATMSTLSNQDDESVDLITGNQKSDSKNPSLISFEFYQQYFDMDTDEILERLWLSFMPKMPSDNSEVSRHLLVHKIRCKPDLYGPFWICTTLIFCIAMTGNMVSYLQTASISSEWVYDFHKISVAATAIYAYVTLMPLVLWSILLYTAEAGDTQTKGLRFIEIVCLYGYSLFIYIPVSIMWTIQISSLQWILVLIGSTLSGAVLGLSLWPTLSKQKVKVTAITFFIVLLFHALLALGLMLYFFHVGQSFTKLDSTGVSQIATAVPSVVNKIVSFNMTSASA